MASRKEQKDQARAERLAREQAESAHAAKRRRYQIFGGITAIAVVLIATVIVVASGGPSAGTTAKDVAKTAQTGKVTAAQKAVVATVNAELKGIPQSGLMLGNPKAKVTMVYFGDLQCPICADFTKGVDGGGFPEFIAKQVKSGQANVVYKSFCTATCSTTNPAPGGGSAAFTNQQVAAYAAGKQNKFWNFAETFYREQGTEDSGYVTEDFIKGLATQVPDLNLVTWTADRADKTLKTQVLADEALASKYGLPGTPSLIMEGPKGKQLVNDGSFSDYAQLEQAYKAVL